MENISLEFLLERKGISKALEKKAREELASKGADRRISAVEKSSKNTDKLNKFGKVAWDIISNLNHGAMVKKTFDQAAADGTLQAAREKGLLDDKEDKQKNEANENMTYQQFIFQREHPEYQLVEEWRNGHRL